MSKRPPSRGGEEGEEPEAKRPRGLPAELESLWDGIKGLLETNLTPELRTRVLAELPVKRLTLFEQTNTWYQTPTGRRVINQLWRLRTLYDFRGRFAEEEGDAGTVEGAYLIARNFEWMTLNGEKTKVEKWLMRRERLWRDAGIEALYYEHAPETPLGRELRSEIVRLEQDAYADFERGEGLVVGDFRNETYPALASLYKVFDFSAAFLHMYPYDEMRDAQGHVLYAGDTMANYYHVRNYWKLAYQHCSNAVAGVCRTLIPAFAYHMIVSPDRGGDSSRDRIYGAYWNEILDRLAHAMGEGKNILPYNTSLSEDLVSVTVRGGGAGTFRRNDPRGGVYPKALGTTSSLVLAGPVPANAADINPIFRMQITRGVENIPPAGSALIQAAIDAADANESLDVLRVQWRATAVERWAGSFVSLEFQRHPGEDAAAAAGTPPPPPSPSWRARVEADGAIRFRDQLGRMVALFRLVPMRSSDYWTDRDMPRVDDPTHTLILDELAYELQALHMDRLAEVLHGWLRPGWPGIHQLLFWDMPYRHVFHPMAEVYYRRIFFLKLNAEIDRLVTAWRRAMARDDPTRDVAHAYPEDRPRFLAPGRLQVLQLALEPAAEAFSYAVIHEGTGWPALRAELRAIYGEDETAVTPMFEVYAKFAKWAQHSGQATGAPVYVRFLSPTPTRVCLEPLTGRMTFQ